MFSPSKLVRKWSRLLTSNYTHHSVIKSLFSSEYPSRNGVNFKEKLVNGPGLSDFIGNHYDSRIIEDADEPPYVSPVLDEKPQKIYIETYGCQMNVSDTEVINSILSKSGFEIVQEINKTDVIFIMTCAIREGAEQKIWSRLKYFRVLKRKYDLENRHPMKIGILGCMAERLKHKVLEKEKIVDIVAGPDSYKDLPRLISVANEGQKAVNVMLSADETYADIMPVRINEASKTAFVSIMRGCNNMCTYCIVPFTRGRERSRPISSILDEIRYLSDQGVKEVTLLGQNVNSYRDTSVKIESQTILSPGFKTVYKTRHGGLQFADLLEKVSEVNPEMRVRFTSPHPKDFPDEVLHLIKERPNICKLLHLPAQSGNTQVLERMRRGYSREAYLDLVQHIKELIPDVGLTSDFICGFCEETEEAHQDTLSLMEEVKYEFAYVFPYSMRQKTHAYYDLKDNVPEDVKKKRADEAHNLFRKHALELHQKEIGKKHLIQVLGPSKRSKFEWSGRNDKNTKVIYSQVPLPTDEESIYLSSPSPGDYIVVKITGCTSQVLIGEPLYHTTLQKFHSSIDRKLQYY